MAVNVGKKYMILKWFAAALLFVALILTAITWYYSVKLKPIITAELKELVLKTTNNLYQIEFSSVDANVLTGISSLSNVTITPDTAVYRQLIALKRAPNNLYKIKLKKLAVRNFHPFRLWRQKKLNIDLLLFDNPWIEMTNRQFDFNDEKLPQPKKSPYDYISKYIKELRINTVDFKNASFKYINNNNPGKQEVDAVDSLNITLKDWLIDPHSATDKSRLYLLKDVIINLNDYSYATSDSLYFVKFNRLDFIASSGKLDVKSFSLEPRYSEQQFGSTLGYAKDRYNIQVANIGFTGINLPLYILKQELFAKDMTIANGTLAVVNNNTLPKKIVNKTGTYPHQLLQKADAKLNIAKLNLNNVDISYGEFSPEGKGKGVITFEQTWGAISNVTNVEKAIARDSIAEAALTSYVMGSGKLNVNFKFNLAARDGAFSYSGSLVDMEGKAFNRITKPLGLVKVNSGYINKLAFDVKANDELAKGTVSFAYKDLSLAVLKRVKGEDRLVKQGLISFLANALVFNKANPGADGKFVTAAVDYKRTPTGSFFNFIWKTLFQGVKYSVGLTPAKEKKIKDQIAKFEQIKADRQARHKRREARIRMRK
ncbi:MAG: hypothetical protein P0Y49_20055 [Candidatus Pedobacter colombiensis]|uniref:DUF748 domain-containing protein n=1 Tax=Candidatus Pedobacter colombiensis TaxID=3121371 RepID=A0AAJ5W5S3_9SPHI|nr:hypothetical protein [Pedobacter sp.]WEK19073.1 MAG: hypothetical protein P0Y49_20055 [Pedobacter sp.]